MTPDGSGASGAKQEQVLNSSVKDLDSAVELLKIFETHYQTTGEFSSLMHSVALELVESSIAEMYQALAEGERLPF